MEYNFFDENPMFLLDHQSLDIIDVNQAATEFYGFSREEFREKKVGDLGKRVERRALIDTAGKTDKGTDKIWVHHTKQGHQKYIQFTYHRFNHDGKPARLAAAHDVTELVEKQGTNTARFPKIENYLTYSPLAIIEWTKDFVVKNWSDNAEAFFGWSEDEVMGKQNFFNEFIHPEELSIAYENRDRAFQQQKINYTVEGRNFTKGGKTRYCEWYNSLLYDDQGNLVSIYSLVNDITERKQSEYLFKALSEESLVGVYLIQDGIFKYVNPQFAQIFNYGEDEIINNMGPLELTHPDDQYKTKTHLEQRISGAIDNAEYEFKGITKGDRPLHLKAYGSRIVYLGKPAIIGTIIDVTERKQTLSRYKASVKSFEDLFDSISDAICIQNREGVFIEVNRGAIDMYGYEREALLGETFEFLAAPGKVDIEKYCERFQEAFHGEEQVLEWWGKRKNGEVFPKEVVLSPGTFFGKDVVIAIVRDISDRYETQLKIRKNEERFRQLFKNAPIGIVMMNQYQEIQSFNEGFEDIFGSDIEEMRGLNIDKIIVPEEYREEAEGITAKMFKGEPSQVVSRRQHKDGSLVDVMIYGVPVVVDGKTETIFGIYVDISDRKKTEERIKKSLREKEVLLAEIHHRVKNNLAVITGLLELQGMNTTSEDALTVLKESQIRINSIALIHEKLYQSSDLSRISFDVYIKELSDLIVNLLIDEERNVEITVDADQIPLTINQAIPCGLILNELITNSYKHAFNGEDKGQIWINLRQQDDQIVLTVQDNGRGLPGDLDTENPMTLGLTLIRTLAKQLKGAYQFENRPESGMSFDLSFGLER